MIREVVSPRLAALRARGREETAGNARADALTDDLEILFRQIEEEWHRIFDETDAEATARFVAETVDGVSVRAFNRLYQGKINVPLLGAEPWLETKRREFIRENTRLIRSIGEDLRANIERVISEGAQAGVPTKRLAAQLSERFGIADRRALLIARDQVAKLNGQITAQRFADAGVKRAIWRSSQDERVRKRHREIDGVVFDLNNPPRSGVRGERQLPGVPINCRCVAEPILP